MKLEIFTTSQKTMNSYNYKNIIFMTILLIYSKEKIKNLKTLFHVIIVLTLLAYQSTTYVSVKTTRYSEQFVSFYMDHPKSTTKKETDEWDMNVIFFREYTYQVCFWISQLLINTLNIFFNSHSCLTSIYCYIRVNFNFDIITCIPDRLYI